MKTVAIIGAVFALGALTLLPACKKGGAGVSAVADAGVGAGELLKLTITDEATHFLYTYLVADGSFKTVDKIADVPAEARPQVIVIDTERSPEERQSSQIIYVADLSQKREDGTYPCRPVSRFKFERDLLREPSQASATLPEACKDLAASPDDHIVLYSASWCGVCKTTAAFLTKEGIPFEEKDVEAPGVQQELSCKALKAKLKPNGVPVIDIGGTLLLGFDRDDVLRLAKRLKPRGPSAKTPAPGSGTTPAK
jgi:glutaredoxin 3